MSLKDNALAVLERNRQRNYRATGTDNAAQLSPSKRGPELRGVAGAEHLALSRQIGVACRGLAITPEQFLALLSEDDKALIQTGKFPQECLQAYAKSLAEGIQSRRIVFHPTTGKLLRHN